jgi:hypothetical protein
VILDEGVDNRVKRFLDNLFRLELGHPNLFRDGFDDLFFRHGERPL